jgi:hypothetical protein
VQRHRHAYTVDIVANEKYRSGSAVDHVAHIKGNDTENRQENTADYP